MAEDLELSSNAKATVLTQNDDVPSCKFEGEPANYCRTIEALVKVWGLKQAGKSKDMLALVSDCLKSRKYLMLLHLKAPLFLLKCLVNAHTQAFLFTYFFSFYYL